jgi:hypothetical protein
MDMEIIVKEINRPTEKALRQFNQHVFEILQKYHPHDEVEQDRGEAS